MIDINLLYENITEEQSHIDEFNRMLGTLSEKKRKMCTILPTDSGNKIRKKCKVASVWGIHHAPVWDRYMTQPDPLPDTGSGDAGDAGGGDGMGEDILSDAKSSTERVRKYYRKHPEKVKSYLRKTVKDRTARNRDRRKAVKKHGKAKMKNHDVHHPKGPNGGSWRLAKKDHGPDKKHENIIPRPMISEGGAAGHMAHPYEDDSLKFSDIKTMIQRGLVGGLDAEAPVSEKLDGQNIMFSIRDGQVIFARNAGHIKNRGKNALNTQDLRQKFAGRGDVEKAFGGAAEDLQAAVDALPQEQKDAMFGGGSKFMNVEIIFPDTKNVIPYDKSVLVFHGTVEYDKDGNEVGRNADDGKTLSNQITKVNAQQQKTFGISGPRTISFSDADTIANKKRMRKYASELARLQNEFKLDDNSTIQDYKREWWSREIDRMAVDWTPEEKEGLISRWAFGEKTFGVKHITDPEKKKFFRAYEQNDLKRTQQIASRPLESIFLRVGADTLRRVTNTLSANNPKLAASLKDELLKTIQDLKATDDEDKLAKLQIQIERLDDLGIDNVVPSEGLVFIYNGKPYKFTGAFAPVNQILGTLKFAKGKVEEPEAPAEPTKKPVAVKSAPAQPVAPTAPMAVQPAPVKRRTVAIFTGRFQPFHAGHYSIYQSMVDKFGKDNVFIATSDRTDPTTSPFGFNEKKDIMTTMFDIPKDMIVKVKNPYAPTEILSKLPPETVYVTAVSQKDADRLSHGKYFRPYDSTPERGRKSHNTQGYLIVAPELQLQVNGKNISGTQLRAVMGDPSITDRAKEEIFTKIYGKFDKKIFSKIVKKTTDSEVARQVTKTYVPKKEKPAGKQPAKKKPKGPPEAEVERDRALYKPGSVWTTATGKFGGKNSKNKIGYFSTKEKATIYAKK